MSATRTQIYLTEEQRRQVDALVESSGMTMAEVIRRALDSYLATQPGDPAAALASTFGADPDAEAPSREEWTRG